MSPPRLTRIAAALPSTVPFVGPETQERALGRPFVARLGANESGFGPSPKALAAMSDAASLAWRYGDPEAFELKAALSAHLGIAADRIVLGEGIDGLLGSLVRLLIEPGDAVVTSDGAYPTFNYHVAGYGGALRKVPYRDDREDLHGLADAAREIGARLVYLANPDNPMGSWHSAEAVSAFAKALSEDCVLCLDEAYGEFAPAGTLPPLDDMPANAVRMRTFSKAYGLAGLRVGYAIAAPELAGGVRQGPQPFRARWPCAGGRPCGARGSGAPARRRPGRAAGPRADRGDWAGERHDAAAERNELPDARHRRERRRRHVRSFRSWPDTGSSFACRSSRRETAASAYPPDRTRNSTCSRRRCRRRSRNLAGELARLAPMGQGAGMSEAIPPDPTNAFQAPARARSPRAARVLTRARSQNATSGWASPSRRTAFTHSARKIAAFSSRMTCSSNRSRCAAARMRRLRR